MAANKNKSSIKNVSIFGAALSSVFIAPEIQADVVDITWNSGESEVVVDHLRVRDGAPLQPRYLDIDQLNWRRLEGEKHVFY